ncbi:DUF6122 family protein [Maribacter aestuarii]|uniref:DUF6122 family protein n=1 Tax=Maribacter aestuarii TaxID=1130723 RepID=UPI00248ACD9C|nr:DUF6122 family protein [Maribacter aestuarii]
MSRFLLHYGIHFVVPILVALVFYKKDSLRAALVLLAGIIIDIDHLIANPIFDAVRCSINFHPLHSYWAIACYVLLFIIPKTRIWGLAFLIHILADYVDCLFLGT